MRARLLGGFAAFILTAGLANAALAEDPPHCDPEGVGLPLAGKIAGQVDSIGWLVGVRWGEGMITFNDGTEQKFKIIGAKLLETGLASTKFEGEIYNVKARKDIEGTYYGASAKITAIVESAGETTVNNGRCVVIKAKVVDSEGLQVSAPSPGGVELSFID